jgi:hypothetical protein
VPNAAKSPRKLPLVANRDGGEERTGDGRREERRGEERGERREERGERREERGERREERGERREERRGEEREGGSVRGCKGKEGAPEEVP